MKKSEFLWPLAIRASGVACVIASSFARIFYRNAINTGLPIVECPELVQDAKQGDKLKVDLEGGALTNLRSGQTYRTSSFPTFILNIIEAGGLVPYTRGRLATTGRMEA